MSARVCAMENCDNAIPASARETTTFCSNCRSGFYYWGKKSPAQVVHRRGRLQLYSERVDHVIAKRRIKT